jgi:hypothetical protein
MMTRRGVLGAAAGLMVLVAGGCDIVKGGRYRYRMTVEIETPQGLKVGYGVREISYDFSSLKLPDSSGVSVKQRGEAVAVDIAPGQSLFALLSVNGYETMQAAFGDDKPETLKAARSDGRVVELHPKPGSIPAQSGYPMLVQFRNLNDPRSVGVINLDNLEASFGPGVRLRRITIQMVDENVTTGIEKRLGWLSNLKGMQNSGWMTLPYESRIAIKGLRAGV